MLIFFTFSFIFYFLFFYFFYFFIIALKGTKTMDIHKVFSPTGRTKLYGNFEALPPKLLTSKH